MSKSKLITAGGEEIPLVGQSSPKVVSVTPCGSQVLVEILTAQEMIGSVIQVSEKTDLKVPLQGYVRALGPALQKENNWGFKIGDRVLISGAGVIAPNWDGTHRDRFLMEPSAIRAVLGEGA